MSSTVDTFLDVNSMWTKQARHNQLRAVQSLEISVPRLSVCQLSWGACSLLSRELVFRRRARTRKAGGMVAAAQEVPATGGAEGAVAQTTERAAMEGEVAWASTSGGESGTSRMRSAAAVSRGAAASGSSGGDEVPRVMASVVVLRASGGAAATNAGGEAAASGASGRAAASGARGGIGVSGLVGVTSRSAVSALRTRGGSAVVGVVGAGFGASGGQHGATSVAEQTEFLDQL